MPLTLRMLKTVKTFPFLDNWGIGISLACSVHCAAMPLIFLSSAFIGSSAGILESIELPLLIIAATIGGVSIIHTYLKTNRVLPVILLSLGLALIVSGSYLEGYQETVFRVSGSLSLVLAHFINKKVLKAKVK